MQTSATTASDWNLLGNAGTVAGTHFLGTTDAQDLVFKTNGVEAVRTTTAGLVGIGTATPTFKLHTISTVPNIPISGYFQISPALAVNATGNYHASWSLALLNSTFNFNDVYGSVNRFQTAAANSGTVSNALGSVNDVVHSGTSTINFARGAAGYIANLGAATINNAAAINAKVDNTGTGTITNGYGVFIDNIQATNKWSVYANDATAPSYFAGRVGIGTTTPYNKLHVYDVVNGTFTGLAIDNRKTYGAGTGTNQTSRIALSLSETTVPDPLNRVMGFIAAGTENEMSSSEGFLSFGTRTTGVEIEKIRITSAGYVGVGTTAPAAKLDVIGESFARNGYGDIVFIGGDNSGNDSQVGIYAPTIRNNISFWNNTSNSPANIIARDITSSTGNFISSDKRYKKNISKIESPLTHLKKINGVTYDMRVEEFKSKGFSEKKQIGVIAQELELIYPELVNTDAEGFKSVDYAKLTPILIEAMKEMDAKMEAQQQQIDALKKLLQK